MDQNVIPFGVQLLRLLQLNIFVLLLIELLHNFSFLLNDYLLNLMISYFNFFCGFSLLSFHFESFLSFDYLLLSFQNIMKSINFKFFNIFFRYTFKWNVKNFAVMIQLKNLIIEINLMVVQVSFQSLVFRLLLSHLVLECSFKLKVL